MNKKKILITGGTGSFGKTCVRTFLEKGNYKQVVVYSRDEAKQFNMRLDFPKETYPNLEFIIGDVRDLEKLTSATSNVDYVVHAAAMKHLEISEYNPDECIKTNITGTDNIVKACIYNKVKKVISVSSDKAVSAVSLYGATKLVSDKLVIAANNLPENQHTRFSVARYGNFMGSKGSVLPLFKRYKEEFGYIPLTDEKMTRFNVGLQEGVDFVLKMLEIQEGSEIFIPKMKSFYIKDLAELVANNEVEINKIGTKQSEKLKEDAISLTDAPCTYMNKDFYVIIPKNKEISDFTYFMNQNLKSVGKDFYYDSLNNQDWLSKDDLSELI